MLKKVRLYDREKVDFGTLLYPSSKMSALLFPIIVEQLLNSLMGMVDTIMVSNVGSQAISAVSLVDSLNNMIILIFSAMASGAVILCSQCIGRGDYKTGNETARQVVLTVLVCAVTVTVTGLLFRKGLLHLIFGKIEPPVMENALRYFSITAVSYPFLALFQAGSAFLRAGGNSACPMKISVCSNGLNAVGNLIFIFGLEMGVSGAALATLLSRIFSVITVMIFLRRPGQAIVLRNYFSIRPDFPLIARVLKIGVPTGIENGMFQFGKLIIQSTVSAMGTMAIAAQAVTNILEYISGIFGIGVGIGLMTMVAQALGAGRKEEAGYYIVKCTKLGFMGTFASCILMFALTGPILRLAGTEEASAALCMEMMVMITLVKPLLWPLSFVPDYGLQAGGDVRFSMIMSTLSMWGARVALCVFLVKTFQMGPQAVWYGMFLDWGVRSIIFTLRFLSGKWIHVEYRERKV